VKDLLLIYQGLWFSAVKMRVSHLGFPCLFVAQTCTEYLLEFGTLSSRNCSVAPVNNYFIGGLPEPSCGSQHIMQQCILSCFYVFQFDRRRAALDSDED